jgi:predicted secreted protein
MSQIPGPDDQPPQEPEQQPSYGAPPPPPPPPNYGSAPVPHGGYAQPAAPPPNYLVWAILTTVFCCLPLGVVSIVFAAQVNGKFAAGDLAGAQDSSNKAKQFAMWSAIAGVVVLGLYVVLIVMLGIGASSN